MSTCCNSKKIYRSYSNVFSCKGPWRQKAEGLAKKGLTKNERKLEAVEDYARARELLETVTGWPFPPSPKPVCPVCHAVLMPGEDIEFLRAHLRFDCPNVNPSPSNHLWMRHVHKFRQPHQFLTPNCQYRRAAIAEESRREWCQDFSELTRHHVTVTCPDERKQNKEYAIVTPYRVVNRDCLPGFPLSLLLSYLARTTPTPAEEQGRYWEGSNELASLHTTGGSHMKCRKQPLEIQTGVLSMASSAQRPFVGYAEQDIN